MLKSLIIGAPSDAHTWNLFYLKLLFTEFGFTSSILGGGISYEDITTEVRKNPWDLIVVSSLNGHFYAEAKDTISSIHEGLEYYKPPIIAGGKLNTLDQNSKLLQKILKEYGYDQVFFGPHPEKDLEHFCQSIKIKSIYAQSFSQAV